MQFLKVDTLEQAREKLGYAYPEEHFYIDVSGTD